MAKRSGRFEKTSLPFMLVASSALGMKLRPRGKGQIAGVIVLLAMLALSPTRVTASIQRPLSSLKQKVVSTVGTHDEVRRAVIVPDVIDVMDFFLPLKKPTEGAFGYEMMLEYIPATVRTRMLREMHQNVTVTIGPDSPFPIWVALSGIAAHRVADAKQHGLAFPLNPPAPVMAASRYWSLSATTTSTNAGRIRHRCAPKVCADSAINLTLSGGFRG